MYFVISSKKPLSNWVWVGSVLMLAHFIDSSVGYLCVCVCVCVVTYSRLPCIFNMAYRVINSPVCVFSGGEVEMARCSVTIIVLNYVLPMTLSYRVYVICVC